MSEPSQQERKLTGLRHNEMLVGERLFLPYDVTTGRAFESDRIFYRTVAVFIGWVLIIVTGGAIILAAYGKDVPDLLLAIGSAAIGAFSGVLVGSGDNNNTNDSSESQSTND